MSSPWLERATRPRLTPRPRAEAQGPGEAGAAARPTVRRIAEWRAQQAVVQRCFSTGGAGSLTTAHARSAREPGRVAFTELFKPNPARSLGTRGVPTWHRPADVDDYVEAGFDPRLLDHAGTGGGWAPSPVQRRRAVG